jgi:adenylate cyclase
MASIIEGYNYDIFISYRQKDNKYDGWVTEFVDNLKKELEATFKEEVSVYFDMNPHDGLLETHDVDASLKDKLKCFVFIPIISRTYCDPKSFAWEHEFKAFVQQVSEDQFGLKVKLPKGNVSSRVLPISIHNLDDEDIKLSESVLGGALRGVEFIYKESGVNRPLTPADDEKTNLNKTRYRNQINKVALAIKEIIRGLKSDPLNYDSVPETPMLVIDNPPVTEKSIAVLPFVDMSPEKDQEYFCNGITEEIINALSHIEKLKVIARTSAFVFKGIDEDVRSIGNKLGVAHLLEGSIRKSGNHLRVTAQLIKVEDGTHLWSEKFDREMNDIFIIQDEISFAIAQELKIKLVGPDHMVIEKYKPKDIDTYLLYLKGNYYSQLSTTKELKMALEFFERTIEKDPSFAPAYCGIAEVYWGLAFFGNLPPNQAFPVIYEKINQAQQIDESRDEIYYLKAVLNFSFLWNMEEAEVNFRKALEINPNSEKNHLYYSMFLTGSGRHEEAILEAKKAAELDPLSNYQNAMVANAYNFAGRFEEAIELCRSSESRFSDHFFFSYFLGFALHGQSKLDEAIAEYEKSLKLSGGVQLVLANLILACIEKGDTMKADKLFRELEELSERIYVLPSHFYKIYRAKNDNDRAFEWFSHSIREHDIYLPFIRIHPYKILKFPDEPRYLELMQSSGLMI